MPPQRYMSTAAAATASLATDMIISISMKAVIIIAMGRQSTREAVAATTTTKLEDTAITAQKLNLAWTSSQRGFC